MVDAYEGAHPELSRSASQAAENIWQESLGNFWLVPEEEKVRVKDREEGSGEGAEPIAPTGKERTLNAADSRILRKILIVLERCKDLELQMAAVKWLEKEAGNLAWHEYESYRKVADALAVASQDSTGELAEHAAVALRSLWNELEDQHKKKLLYLKSESADEDTRARAIWQLADKNTLGSREAVHKLVGHWVEWISLGKQPRLVELTAEALRYNRYAVPAIIEYFDGNQGNQYQDEKKRRIDRRLAKQLADMSDPLLFGVFDYQESSQKQTAEYQLILRELKRLAVPVCLERLATNPASTLINGGQTKAGNDDADPALDAGGQQGETATHDKRNEPQATALFVQNEKRREEPATDDERPGSQEIAVGDIEKRREVSSPALAGELEIRENLVRTLAYSGGREGVEALSRLVVGKEKERLTNQDRLDEFYLRPSRDRRQQAAKILAETVKESERTLATIKSVNVLVFLVGLVVLASGLAMFLFGEFAWNRWLGFVAAFGGGAGMISLLVWDPLDRIQNATASLVEVETAFTGFIWKLNLNQTLVQSRYINNGELQDEEIQSTLDRMERAMELTMSLVAAYTKPGEQRVVSRITRIEPATAAPGTRVTVFGQHLFGDSSQAIGPDGRGGSVAINHIPLGLDRQGASWQENQVQVTLPGNLTPGTTWISLFINGLETNALPIFVEESGIKSSQTESSNSALTKTVAGPGDKTETGQQ
jgi:hypothetical protein